MIPADGFAFEHCGYDDGEDCQRDGFLYDFQLHQCEWTSVDLRADAVGGNHEAVFEECQSPRTKNDEDERPVGIDFQFREFEVSVPGKRHENVGTDKQQYGNKSF